MKCMPFRLIALSTRLRVLPCLLQNCSSKTCIFFWVMLYISNTLSHLYWYNYVQSPTEVAGQNLAKTGALSSACFHHVVLPSTLVTGCWAVQCSFCHSCFLSYVWKHFYVIAFWRNIEVILVVLTGALISLHPPLLSVLEGGVDGSVVVYTHM